MASPNVLEGSFIVRAHTPMSNLFSCLWFNEVNYFTSCDQLSFAYTLKLKRLNLDRPFFLNMFKALLPKGLRIMSFPLVKILQQLLPYASTITGKILAAVATDGMIHMFGQKFLREMQNMVKEFKNLVF
ncbi:hypothetical protein HYC85_009970 [Camellia sinensis]|uniref:TOD1/MUCI70 glycosyltransferase-like domain-containing protein n=1 Tax=Camellia sinensis TaxID=4442 RepID=A0A7J7HJD5_CAMSI|nr:hypothetical protein HYC85_009970 [Camellia sinensis]